MMLVISLIGLSGYFCHANWRELGSETRGGVRAAIEYVRERRTNGEPVVAGDIYALLGARHYLPASTYPLLCVEAAQALNTSGIFGMENIDAKKLVTPGELDATGFQGFWYVTCLGMPFLQNMDVSTLKTYELKACVCYKQEYEWEGYVILQHMVRSDVPLLPR